ncbi:MAG TPA: DUF169 domain-containing protein [Candidatus Acidoferrum sp.]|nr:DUF169 domain-containing protein [Candidatus Acidoferrum sp.]
MAVSGRPLVGGCSSSEDALGTASIALHVTYNSSCFQPKGDVLDHSDLGNNLDRLLGLKHAAIAIAFLGEAPAGMSRVKKAGPAGCSYWKLATDGETFYTTGEDHQNCPVGAYTHGVKLGAEKSKELQGMIGQMISLNYLQEAEIPQIPHREQSLAYVAYSPLKKAPFEPQIVLIRGDAKHLMLLTEAMARAGVASEPMMMRPTCAVLPQVLKSGHASHSLGCIGNRVYTGLGDDEFYCAIPAAKMGQVVAELENIVSANNALKEFHQARFANA